ncbi:MAG: class I SAM-dependent methyltransferase [Desulfovermiculus sp.]|nr:class I SAM-dependent methyltransferase [Desulfovermiculus sp.]
MGIGQDQERARALAAEFEIPLTDEGNKPALRLEVSSHEVRLAGYLPGEAGKNVYPIRSDLSRINAFPGWGKPGDVPLYRAILGKKRGPGRVVFDATGGLGRDAWLLATIGCSLVVIEREAVIFALLRDGVARAGIDAQQVARRIRLVHAQSEDVLGHLGHELQSGTRMFLPEPHVVYLDPFFHSQRKRKGASKRSLQVIRHVAGECEMGRDREILDLALQVAMERVVVKRPKQSDPLGSRYGRLTHSIRGRGCRFDVYQ